MLARAHTQMSTGTMISGAGHLAIILWVILGGTLFRTDRDPLPVTTNVTLISEAAFEGREATRPEVITEAPDAPQPAPPLPEAAPEPVPERPVETPPPPPRPEPQPAPEAPAEAPSVPETAPPPPPPPAERVAPEPVPQPSEDVQVAEEQQEAATPDGAGSEAAEPQEATAPEAASTRIITEATETAPDSTSEEIALAPVATPRPKSRPARPERAVEAPPEEPALPEADPLASAVASAVAEASQAPPAADPALPVGPPMTSSEREGLRVAVQQCWNIGSLSSEAMRTTVTVAVEMEQNGRPVTGSIRMIDAEGGSDAAAQQAFEAARRAIIRCGARGFDLPVEKFAQWRDIEMTFNPERMRIR
jgi:hypothetical protein